MTSQNHQTGNNTHPWDFLNGTRVYRERLAEGYRNVAHGSGDLADQKIYTHGRVIVFFHPEKIAVHEQDSAPKRPHLQPIEIKEEFSDYDKFEGYLNRRFKELKLVPAGFLEDLLKD